MCTVFVRRVDEGRRETHGSACAFLRLVRWALCSSRGIDLCLFELRRRIHCCSCRVLRARLAGRAWISYRVLHLFDREEGVMLDRLGDVDVCY